MAKRVAVKGKAKIDPVKVAKLMAKSQGIGIDSGGLLNELIDCWGGKRAFARDIFAEYQFAQPGSLQRQRILEMISRLTVQVTSQEISRPRGAVEMSDEELLLAAEALLERLQDHGERPATPAAPEA